MSVEAFTTNFICLIILNVFEYSEEMLHVMLLQVMIIVNNMQSSHDDVNT